MYASAPREHKRKWFSPKAQLALLYGKQLVLNFQSILSTKVLLQVPRYCITALMPVISVQGEQEQGVGDAFFAQDPGDVGVLVLVLVEISGSEGGFPDDALAVDEQEEVAAGGEEVFMDFLEVGHSAEEDFGLEGGRVRLRIGCRRL